MRGKRKTVRGTVISDKMDKTIIVVTETMARHPLYGKFIRKRKKLYVHDGENQCSLGDVVLVAETRPLSRLKRWRVVSIIKKAEKLE